MKVVLHGLTLCALLIDGCGPAHPPLAPTGTTTHLTLETIDGNAIANATVRACGETLATTASGVVLPCDGVATVRDVGYINRTLNVTASRTDVLWEDSPFLPYATTWALAYNTQGYFFLPKGPVMTVALDTTMLSDGRSEGALAAAVATHNDIDPRFQFEILPPGAKAQVRVLLDPQLDYGGALTYFDSFDSAGYLTAASVKFAGTAGFYGPYLEAAFVHELGHVRGLQDTPATDKVWVMDHRVSASRGPALDFSPQEKRVLQYMLDRKPGNHPPDSEQ